MGLVLTKSSGEEPLSVARKGPFGGLPFGYLPTLGLGIIYAAEKEKLFGDFQLER